VSDFSVLPDDLARLRAMGRLTLSRSPITKRWRVLIAEAGFDKEAPSRLDLFQPAREAAQRSGML
jgi:hypothetical protein